MKRIGVRLGRLAAHAVLVSIAAAITLGIKATATGGNAFRAPLGNRHTGLNPEGLRIVASGDTDWHKHSVVGRSFINPHGYNADTVWHKCSGEKPWILGKRTLPLQGDWFPDAPVWDKVGENIAFRYSSNQFCMDEWICDHDGGHVLPLLMGSRFSRGSYDTAVSWSLDGTALAGAYCDSAALKGPSNNWKSAGICIYSFGPGPSILNIVASTPDRGVQDVSWRPGEKTPVHLLYTLLAMAGPSKGQRESEVHILNVNTKEDRIIPLPDERILRSIWMPDGVHVVYLAVTGPESNRHAELFIVDIDGSRRRQLTTHEDVNPTNIAVSPSGKSIVYSMFLDLDVKVLDVKSGKVSKFMNTYMEKLSWSSQNELAGVEIGRDTSAIVVYKIKPNVF